MKSAFALRTHLGDPGPCTNEEDCFLDLEAVMNDTLSEEFADGLRYTRIYLILLQGGRRFNKGDLV